MAEESLKKKTIKGVGWSAIDAFSGKGVTFLVGIVLARLLSPAEYGLIGICVIVNSILDGFVDSGFGSSLIRKKDVSNDDYNTMFITNFVISIIIYGALYWCTPYIADFFGQAQLSSLIRVPNPPAKITTFIVFLSGSQCSPLRFYFLLEYWFWEK